MILVVEMSMKCIGLSTGSRVKGKEHGGGDRHAAEMFGGEE